MEEKIEIEGVRRVSKKLAECTLFLKKNDAFPLTEPGVIAAYGSGVRNTIKGGTGSGDVYTPGFVSVEQGLLEHGFELLSSSWLNEYDKVKKNSRKAWVKMMKKEAKAKHVQPVIYSMGAVMPEPEYDLPLNFEAESCIYVLSRICGEGSDRRFVKGDYLLTDSEVRDILSLNEKYGKFMLVLNVGGPVDLTPVKEVSNILLLSQLGTNIGNTLADILLGKSNPSGKLTTTWVGLENYPFEKEFSPTDTFYKEGIYVGYRYYDTFQKDVLYPFGFGLSYSSFSIQNVSVTNEKENIIVYADVENTSSIAGKEVVQVYVSCPNGILKKAYQDLAGFKKTGKILPGESDSVEISFRFSDLASYDVEKERYFLEKGEYFIRVGNSSQNTQVVAKIVLEENVVTKEAMNLFPKDALEELIAPEAEKEEHDVPSIVLSPFDFALERMSHENVIIPKEVYTLSDEELASINVGYFNPKGGLASLIGQSSSLVPGAAGQTSDTLGERLHRSMAFADGPAGLRLTSRYYVDKKGVHSLDKNPLMEDLYDFLPKIAAFFAKKLTAPAKAPQDAIVKTQYTTALPISTAIAQSWNEDFAYLCGDVVGEECEQFKVNLWLAPALNIHRSPLCGRNFEYFSEDPLLSGMMASFITQGVQSHSRVGVTIKHFAANNQETNRYSSNSIMSERTLREIYLKGFAYCIREASPRALMTSYNLINGKHTSENRSLVHDFLYGENHYQGIVMTDWIIHQMYSKKEKYPGPRAGAIVNTGTSLVMPGSKEDVQDILTAMKDKFLSRSQLEINVTRLIHVIDEMRH